MIHDFIRYELFIKGHSIATITAYRRNLSKFARWAKDNKEDARWSNITREDIDRYITEEAANGMSASSTNQQLAALSELYKWMKRQGMEIENPVRYETRRKIAQTQPNTITMDELKTAYQHSAGTVRHMLGVLMTTGIRIQELLDMRIEDINKSNGATKIHGKGSKERTIYIPTTITDEILKGREAYGLIFQCDQRAARTMIYEALKNYCHAPQLSPHAIRHTYATYLASIGINATTIAKILGHDSIRTTQKYIDMTQQDVSSTMMANAIIN